MPDVTPTVTARLRAASSSSSSWEERTGESVEHPEPLLLPPRPARSAILRFELNPNPPITFSDSNSASANTLTHDHCDLNSQSVRLRASILAGHGQLHVVHVGQATGSGKCARVILPDGGVRRVPLPATAAELMMDLPGHLLFVVDARPGPTRGLGSRLAALPADAELQLGAVYAAFPKLGAVARLAAAAANREARRSSSSAKVASAAVVVVASPPPPVEEAPRLRLEELLDDAAAAELIKLKRRASNARSRRPRLETIEEEN